MFQTADDFIIFLGWVFHNTTLVLKEIFLPFRFVFAFLKSAFVSASASPITPDEIFTFDPDILIFFHSIPHIDILISGIFLGLGLICLFALFKILQSV